MQQEQRLVFGHIQGLGLLAPRNIKCADRTGSFYLRTLADLTTIAGHFKGKPSKKRLGEVERLLETIAALGRAQHIHEGGWVGVK